MKYILSVIAVCLVLITAKLYIPEANAEVGRMDHFELRRDIDFKKAVRYLVENDTDIENSIEEIVLEKIKRNYSVEDAIEDIVADAIRSDYETKRNIKSIVNSCSIFIDSFALDGGYVNLTCL